MKKLQINPIIYITSSFLIGGIVSHILFGGFSKSDLDQKIFPYKKEISMLKKDTSMLKKDTSLYQSKNFILEKKVKSDFLQISTLKTDLFHSLIASEYFFEFSKSWTSCVINSNFDQAENLENTGFASMKFLVDLKKSYGLDTLILPYSSFQERLKPYLSKEHYSSSK